MAGPNRFAAELLEQAATAYAGYAASAMGDDTGPRWRDHLAQRVRELAAALRAGEVDLFVRRAVATRQSFRTHDLEEADVAASLRALREVLAERLPPPARPDATAFLDAALTALEQPLSAEAPGLSGDSDVVRLALRYLATTLEGDGRGAIDLVLAAVSAGLDARTAYTDVLLPVQAEVGRMWHAGEVTVAEEHYVTETTQRALAVVVQNAERAPSNGKTVLAAAVAGNVHAVGARALADLLELDGWRAVCLGADLPPAEIGAAAEFFEADLVALSAAIATQLKAVEATLTALRAGERSPPVMVGGTAFVDTPDLWQRMGADGYAATASEAVAVAASLTAS